MLSSILFHWFFFVLELSKIAVDPETSGTDFSADESDEYQPTETVAAADGDSSSSSSDHAITSASSDDDQNRRPIAKYVPPTIKTTAAVTTTGRVTRSSARRQCDFVLESDGYFSHHTNKKVHQTNDAFCTINLIIILYFWPDHHIGSNVGSTKNATATARSFVPVVGRHHA